jgi:ubiquinone/menaquinone biosynthesis C-methylase UbiE
MPNPNYRAGPGWWLIDMAKEYPKSHFTGSDVMIYPISPPPTNCHLRVIDISNGLPFLDNSFDFVTQHDTLFRYSQKDWEIVLPELVRVLKPGGYLELVEPGGAIQDCGPNMSIWMMRCKLFVLSLLVYNPNPNPNTVTVSLQTRNINLKIANQLQQMLENLDALENMEASHRSAPIGWYGRNGDIMLECIERLFDAVKNKICEDWSMTVPKYDKVIQSASAECRDFRSWLNIHYFYGKKKAIVAAEKKDNEEEEKAEEAKEEEQKS